MDRYPRICETLKACHPLPIRFQHRHYVGTKTPMTLCPMSQITEGTGAILPFQTRRRPSTQVPMTGQPVSVMLEMTRLSKLLQARLPVSRSCHQTLPTSTAAFLRPSYLDHIQPTRRQYPVVYMAVTGLAGPAMSQMMGWTALARWARHPTAGCGKA